MVRKRNSYLSAPRHLGAGIKVPRLRVDVRDLPWILRTENFRQDGNYSREYNYPNGRLKPEVLSGYDWKKQDSVNLIEVFSRLEKINEIEISQEKGYFGGFFHVTALLCDVAKVDYNASERDLFLYLGRSLEDCEKPRITWQKEESRFCLTISWGTATEKIFKAQTLIECFNQADYFVF